MGRDDYSQSSQLSTLVGKPVSRYTKLPKNTNTLKKLTDIKAKPNNRFHYSIYPSVETEYQASYSQLTNLDFYSPVITILGDNPYSHLINTPFTDPGVALDETSTLVSTESTVNTSEFGTFNITYVATDGINPDTTRVRTVKVGEFPEVTIDGENPYILERYDQYIDEGVTTDSNSYLRSVTSTLNNTVVGNYTVNYTVSNQVFTSFHSRTVKVVDTTPPVVTILGDNPYTLERFDVYTDPGATGDLDTIVTPDLSNVQNTSIGSFVVVYNATDGNTLHDVAVTRTVNVVDTVPPVITVLGDDPFTLERFDVYTDPGATVDLGSTLTTDLSNVNNAISHNDSFTIVYTATDGNTAHDVVATRTVVIEDTKPPVITLLGDNPYQLQPRIDFIDVDPGYEVDLGTSVSIDYSNAVTTDNSNFYVVYRASDGVNPDAVVLRRVAVADTLPAIVTIIGDNPYTLERYVEYIDPGATTDTESGSRFVSITNNVDNTAVGSYTVTYVATDDINPETTARRIVNVVDTTSPIVTLNGASSVTLERYGVFADIDEGVEIEAPGSLVSVDTSQLDNTTQGTYTVTYNVVDDQNNANVITREVVVQDTVPPVVSLVDPNTTYVLERYGVWADIDPGVEFDDGSYVYQVNLDNTSTGLQSVEYIVRDGTNQTTVYRTIRVVDTTPPVITFNEPEYVHEIYTQYTDPGATVDAGSILTVDTSNADVSNTANIGTFDVVYSATDGNTAHDVTVIRTVTVVDTTLPVATLKSDPYTTERFGTYSDPGLNLDAGSFIANIDLSNVDTSIAHGSTFDVVYDVSDSNVSHNVYVTRRVTVTDTIDPQLVGLVGYDPHYITIGTDYEENGILLDEGSSYTESNNLGQSLGNYTVTYSATDVGGNSNTFSRDLVVAPEIYSNVIDNLTASSLTGYTIITSKSKTAPHKFVWGRNGNGIFCNFDPVSGTVSREAGFSNASAGDYRKGAMRSDGLLYAVAYGARVVIFKYENSSWSSSQTIQIDVTREIYSVDITPNGNILVVGVEYYSEGSIYVYQYINGSYVLQTSLIFTDPGRYNGYYVKVSGFGDRIFVGDSPSASGSSYKIRIYNYVTGNLSLDTTITIPQGFLSPAALQISEDGLTMAVDMLTSSQRTLIYKYVSGTWSLSHTIQHNQFQQNAILMTYDASYILILPSGLVYKKLPDYTYKLIYDLPNDMNAISYTGDFIYNSTLSSSSQVNVLKKEITQLPVEMNGRIQTNILKDSVYTDEGVIVRSDYSLESTVSTVNNTEFGTYTVTYTASENSNVATAVRKVTVSPLEFNNLNYILERFESYVEQGATLLPGYELTIDTSNVTTSNTTNVGTFDIVYTATNDTTGHESSLIRKISVEDTTAPVITLEDGDVGTSDYTVERGTTYSDPGATSDGGELVTIDATNLVMSISGTYTVNYFSKDSYGNIGTTTRTVVVRDTIAPVVTLTGSNSITVERGTTYIDPGATSDGGETVTVNTSQLNMSVTGTYTVTYSATDAAGNTGTASRTVIVMNRPVIYVLGSNPFYQQRGYVYGDSGAYANGGETVITDYSALNTGVNGTYTVYYSTDSEIVGTATRTVIVGNYPTTVAATPTINNIFSSAVNSTGSEFVVGANGGTSKAYYSNGVQKGGTLTALKTNYSGWRCGMSASGNRIIIGEPNFFGTGGGNARLYDWNGYSWSTKDFGIPSGYSNFNLGSSVAISDDGNTVFISDYQGQGVAYNSGYFFVARYVGSSWFIYFQVSGGSYQYFGDGDMSGDARTVVAILASGNGHLYTYRGTPGSYSYMSTHSFATGSIPRSVSLSTDGNTLAYVESLNAKIYYWTSSGWIQLGLNIPVNTVDAKVRVSGDGRRIVIGDYAYSGGQGIVQTHEWNGSVWSQVGSNFIGSSNQGVGKSVSINYRGDRNCITWNSGAKLEQNRSRT
jgi:hypothetical protein